MVTHHGRDQIDYVKVGAKRDGTLTAWHTKIIADLGAYQMLLTPLIPPLSAFVMCGVYKTPAVHTDVISVMTNKFPTDAIRGAGRPEATHLIEVTMDQLADELGMDRLELRRKNFIPPFAEPHETAIGVAYDSGNYAGALDKLLEHIDPAAIEARARREAARARASTAASGSARTPRSAATRRRAPSARAASACRAAAGSRPRCACTPPARRRSTPARSPHGQGHETGFAQIVADRLGIDPQQVDVIHGDTQTGPFGLDTYGSRSLAVGGEAAARAAKKVADKARAIVAHQLEADPADIELARRQVHRRRLARQGHDAGRGLGRRVHPGEPARGDGAGARRDVVLRPGELRVPVRRARVRGRRRRRRPATSRSSATSRSTTAGRRSTRC